MADHSRWLEHKERLAGKGLVHPIFMELHRWSFKADAAHEFEPLLIARHAQRLGELIDRCLAIRKDIRELEVLEVKAATDYDLFNSTSTLDEQMEILRLQMASKASEQAGFEKAAAAFDRASTLEKGLTEIAKGRDAALEKDLKNSGDIRDLITKRWKSLRAYQDAYHARHTEPGNAHFYGERAKLLLEVLTVLMQEALARATALAAGIRRVYHAKMADVPTSVTLQTVDRFAVWALKTIQSLSRAAEQETVSEVIIPLVQPWFSSEQPLIKETDFDKAVSEAAGAKPISLWFDLPDNGLLSPRTSLKSVGVSFGNETDLSGSGIDKNQTLDLFTRLAVKITTPVQEADDGTRYHRPPVIIGNVALHGAGSGSTVEGTAIENISPFGRWTIEIHPLFVWKDGSKQSVSAPNIGNGKSNILKDLKLTLRFYVPGEFP